MLVRDLRQLAYELSADGLTGRVVRPVAVSTGITGYKAELSGIDRTAVLYPDGRLFIAEGFVWDFGSGPAVQTPAMVRASLVHDVLCDMTNARLLPWSCRAKADRLFRQLLKEYAPRRAWYNPMRLHPWWRWAGVAAYSQLIARWSDRVSEPA